MKYFASGEKDVIKLIMNKVFTIGYAGIQLPQFMECLKQNQIAYLIDVRSIPRSRYFSVYNDTSIKKELEKQDICYMHLKSEFGARQDDLCFYINGIMDFEKFSKSKQFKSGVRQVENLLKNGNVCFMCAEIDPLNCHRAILCAKAFQEIGIDVAHIIAKRNGEILYEKHIELENRLLDLYKKQIAVLQTVYKLHNKKIGYRIVNN